jgi:hypothetical protein
MADMHELDKRITSHEAVCAERYANLIARIGRMEMLVLMVNGFVTSGLVCCVVYFVNRGLH